MIQCIPKLLQKIFYFFSLMYIRMSGKNINFNNKKIRKSTFYLNKKINNIEDIVIKIHLNTLLDIMIMILSDHYV